jgi:hypothetical protein
MLADLHPRQRAFPAQGIEQAPPGRFTRGEGSIVIAVICSIYE